MKKTRIYTHINNVLRSFHSSILLPNTIALILIMIIFHFRFVSIRGWMDVRNGGDVNHLC